MMEKVILEECQQMDAWRAVPYDLQWWVLAFTGNGWAVIYTHTQQERNSHQTNHNRHVSFKLSCLTQWDLLIFMAALKSKGLVPLKCPCSLLLLSQQKTLRFYILKKGNMFSAP